MKWISTLLVFIFIFKVEAFKLSPMSQTLIPQNGQKHLLFSVENKSTEPIAVQLNIAERKMDEWGKEKHPDVEREFIIFPDQLIIKAKEKRTVKVSYLGNKNIKYENAYRLIAEQLPIDVANQNKNQKTNIKILLKYVAAIYVAPKKGKSEIRLVSNLININNKSFVIELENVGSHHEILNKYKIKLKSKDSSITLEKENLKGLFGENLLANHKRKFRLKTPKTFMGKKQVKLELVRIE